MYHQLIVEYLGNGEYEHDVAHIPDCQFVEEEDGFGHWVCPLGTWVSWYGLEDLANENEELYETPGRHSIEFYSYIPDSMFEDPEQYIYFIDNKSKVFNENRRTD